MTEPLTERSCPFVGLHAFTDGEADYFVGRTRDTEIIAAHANVSSLTILYGASGAGKSSILQAGVVPFLKNTRNRPAVYFRDFLIPHFQDVLQARCVNAANEYVARRQDGKHSQPHHASSTPIIAPDDADPDLSDAFVAAFADATKRIGGPLVLVLDQFEDYLLRNPDSGRFDRTLAIIVNRKDLQARVLIGIREDYLAKLDRLRPRIPNLLSNTLRLEKLSRDAANEILRQPIATFAEAARAQGADHLVVEVPGDDDPVQEIVKEVTTGSHIEAAALQLTMKHLWAGETTRWQDDPSGPRKGSRQLRLSVLKSRNVGGVAGILRTYLDARIDGLGDDDLGLTYKVFKLAVGPDRQCDPVFPASFPIGQQDAVESLLGELTKREIFRHVTPGRFEIVHQVLAGTILSWCGDREKEIGRLEARKEARGRLQRIALWAGAATITVLVGLLVMLVLAQRDERSASWALRAHNVVDADPEWAMTLAHLAQATSDTPDARGAVTRAVDRSFVLSYLCGTADPTATTNDVTYSPDGRILATASTDTTVRLWNANGSLLSQLDRNVPNAHTGSVNAAVFGPESTRMVTVGDDKKAVIWDTTDPKSPTWLGTLQQDREIWTAAISRDGRMLATGGEGRSVWLWSLTDSFPYGTLYGRQRATDAEDIATVVFSSDSKRLLTAGRAHHATIWDVATREPLFELQGHTDYIYGAAFKPKLNEPKADEPDEIATASWDGTVRLWSIPAKRSPGDVRAPETLRSSATLRSSLDLSSEKLWDVSYSPDGRLIAAAGRNGEVTVWDQSSHSKAFTFSNKSTLLTALAFSADSKSLAVAAKETPTKVFDVSATRLAFPAIQDADNLRVVNAAFSEDGKGVLVAGTRGERADGSRPDNMGVMALFDLSATPPTSYALSGVKAGTFTRDGSRLATVAFENDEWRVVVWSRSGQRLHTLDGPKEEIVSASIDPGGRYVSASSRDKNVWVWRLDGDSNTSGVPLPFNNLTKAEKEQKVEPKNERPFAVAFDPSGRFLAASGTGNGAPDASVKIWILDSLNSGAREPARSAKSAIGDVIALRYSPDGDRLAIGGLWGPVALWDLRTLESTPQYRYAHYDQITDLKFNKTGSQLVTTSLDGKAIVSDLASNRQLPPFYPDRQGVVTARFDEDRTITTFGMDRALHQHSLKWEDIQKRADGLGRLPTRWECQTYFGVSDCKNKLPVRDPCELDGRK